MVSNVNTEPLIDAKTYISLISVTLGWLLGQGTAIIKDWWAARKLCKGLLSELDDIQNQLQRVVMIHGRQLQIFALKGIEPACSLPIQNMFFNHYFKDAFPYLNRDQRLSYQLIHSSIENLNKKEEALAKYAEDFCKAFRNNSEEENNTMIEFWGDLVVVIYKTAMEVRWHIAYHINNPEAPTYDLMGSIHESYLKFEQELDEEVKSIVDKAKILKKEDFERIYDPKFFSTRNL